MIRSGWCVSKFLKFATTSHQRRLVEMPLHHVASHLQNASRARSSVTSIPYSKMNLQIALGLYNQGFLTSVQRGSIQGPDTTFTPITNQNVATRRLWIGLKFRNAQPVLQQMHVVSKPSRKIYMDTKELKLMISGRKGPEMINGLQLGEVCFVGTDQGVLEVREAVERNLGGEVLVRAS